MTGCRFRDIEVVVVFFAITRPVSPVPFPGACSERSFDEDATFCENV
jgi:hypothetical protein